VLLLRRRLLFTLSFVAIPPAVVFRYLRCARQSTLLRLDSHGACGYIQSRFGPQQRDPTGDPSEIKGPRRTSGGPVWGRFLSVGNLTDELLLAYVAPPDSPICTQIGIAPMDSSFLVCSAAREKSVRFTNPVIRPFPVPATRFRAPRIFNGSFRLFPVPYPAAPLHLPPLCSCCSSFSSLRC